MTLTVGKGPLAGHPAGRTNFTIDAPKHRLLLEDLPYRLRAVAGGCVVFDTTRAKALHETGHQLVAYVPLEDFDADLLVRSDTTTHCPFKGDASYWSLRTGDTTIDDAVWAYEDPLEEAAWLAGLAALRWDAADARFVEDEIVFGPHLRDPYHRVDVHGTSRPVTVRLGGEVIARSSRAKLLSETSLPVRVYVPRADVAPGVLVPSDKRTECPYKGRATYFSVEAGGRRVEDAAWAYETPLPEAQRAAGDVCFDSDDIEVVIGEAGQASG